MRAWGNIDPEQSLCPSAQPSFGNSVSLSASSSTLLPSPLPRLPVGFCLWSFHASSTLLYFSVGYSSEWFMLRIPPKKVLNWWFISRKREFLGIRPLHRQLAPLMSIPLLAVNSWSSLFWLGLQFTHVENKSDMEHEEGLQALCLEMSHGVVCTQSSTIFTWVYSVINNWDNSHFWYYG